MRAFAHPDPIDIHVGQRMRLARRAAEVSQGDVANASGITYQQIQKYETGANRVSASMLYHIGRSLAVPVSYFYEGLPAYPANEQADDRQIREFAQSPRGATLLEAAMHLPAAVVMAHVEALQAAGTAISVASTGPKQDPVR